MDAYFAREMQWEANDGTWYPCSIAFSLPVAVGNQFEVQFQAYGFGDETVYTVLGFDQMQAMYLAMCVAGELVRKHPIAPKLNLRGLPGRGFPELPDVLPPE